MVDPIGTKKLADTIKEINDSLPKTIDDIHEKIVLPFAIPLEKISTLIDKLIDFFDKVGTKIINIDWEKTMLSMGGFVIVVILAIKAPEIIEAFGSLTRAALVI